MGSMRDARNFSLLLARFWRESRFIPMTGP
jgi:hypothetical protein